MGESEDPLDKFLERPEDYIHKKYIPDITYNNLPFKRKVDEYKIVVNKDYFAIDSHDGDTLDILHINSKIIQIEIGIHMIDFINGKVIWDESFYKKLNDIKNISIFLPEIQKQILKTIL